MERHGHNLWLSNLRSNFPSMASTSYSWRGWDLAMTARMHACVHGELTQLCSAHLECMQRGPWGEHDLVLL